MTFKGEEFFLVGEHLENYSKEEAYQRTAVGRFYYACYIKCRNYFESKTNGKLGKNSPHKKLIDFFKDSNNEVESKIGLNLEDLKRIRIKADYKTNFKENSVSDSRSKARKIFNLFKELEN